MSTQCPHVAAAAWILHSGSSPSSTCHRVTQVHGPPLDINSYWAKLQGMLALLLAINNLCSSFNLTSSQITISCDNKGVNQLAQCCWSYIPCLQKHADLLWAILSTCNLCPMSLQFQYVAGHQDNLTWFKYLPLLAQLNIQVDSMAKQALHVLCCGTLVL